MTMLSSSKICVAVVIPVSGVKSPSCISGVHMPAISGDISAPYRFEAKGLEDKVLENALVYMNQLEAEPAPHLDQKTVDRIFDEIPGLLPGLRQFAGLGS